MSDGETSAAGRPLPRAFTELLAAELVRASTMLGELAWELGSDPDTLRRHMSSLQQIDHVTQIQLAVAGLLRGVDDPAAGIAQVTLEEMANRLRAALDQHEQDGGAR